MATYYVDSVSGNDTWDGSQPAFTTGIHGPWQTFQAVNAHVFVPGDVILFKRGGVWNYTLNPLHPTLNITVSGTSGMGNSITWGAYGTGANPLFSGFIDTTGSWTSPGGNNLWVYHAPTSPAIINILTINGVPQGYGRFPKSGYNTYTASSGITMITDPDLPNLPSFVNGEVVIRKNHLTLTRGIVNSQVGTTINYTAPGTAQATAQVNYGYFFQNHINCLTHQGDWCYDGAGNITMYSLTMPVGVKASVVDTLVLFSNAKSYHVFNNISFEGANNYGINGAFGGTNNQIDNCTFSNMGNYAIYLGGANTCTVSNNTITDTMNLAMLITNSINTQVSYNTVNRSGQIVGMGQSSDGGSLGTYVGIRIGHPDPMVSNGCTANNNTILNIGFSGLQIYGGGFKVDSNYVNTFCNVMDDGGGIYTNVGTTVTYAYAQRVISNNIVLNSIGAPDGTSNRISQANGIHCDDNATNVTINNNTVSLCAQYGIYLQDSQIIDVIDNLSYNNTISQLTVVHDANTNQLTPNHNINIFENIIMANSPTQLWYYFKFTNPANTAADFQTFGSSDNNNYWTFFTNLSLFKTELTTALGGATLRDIISWQSYITPSGAILPQDSNSFVDLYQNTDQLPVAFSRHWAYDLSNAIL